MNYAPILRENIQVKRRANAKVILGEKGGWQVHGIARNPVWLEQSEQGVELDQSANAGATVATTLRRAEMGISGSVLDTLSK